MTHRHALARATIGVLLAFALPACTRSHGGPEGGVCCPVTGFTGCSPGFEPLPGGGWAESLEACTYTISGFDGPPFVRVLDDHGCARVQEDYDSPGCGIFVDAAIIEDAGPPTLDAGGTDCDGLGPVTCLQRGCTPTFDDACCPECTVGGCADCQHWTYFACATPPSACGGHACGTTAPWSCGGASPDCSGAHVNAIDACDIPGCVPAYPSGEGDPDPSAATCAPIHAQVCTVACRRVAPPCPSGTVPEGDGSCYTDRCIPAFVCN